MKVEKFHFLTVCGLLTSLVLPSLASPSLAQTGPVQGYIIGKVFDRDGDTPLRDAIVAATLITTNQVFQSGPADKKGNFIIRNAESGVYAFTVIHRGREYAVPDRLDARVRMVTPEGEETSAKMTFLLEVCFRRDRDDDVERTAIVVREECQSELPPFLAGLLQEGITQGAVLLIAGGTAVAATVGVLAATGGEVASSPAPQR